MVIFGVMYYLYKQLWRWDFVISKVTLCFEILKYAYTDRQAEADTHSFETASSAEWISLPLHISSEHVSLVNCLAHSILTTPVDL